MYDHNDHSIKDHGSVMPKNVPLSAGRYVTLKAFVFSCDLKRCGHYTVFAREPLPRFGQISAHH